MHGELSEMPVKQGSGIRKSGKVFGQGQKAAKTIRAGLYARVSTLDQQTLPMQSSAVREYAARRSWTVAMQVKEVGSGTTQRQRREELMLAARRREIDVVLVWRLDRWGRSVTYLLATMQELEHLGVGFVSLTEALDLTTRRPCDGCAAGRFRCLRARDPWGARAGRSRSCPPERQAAGPTLNRRAPCRPGPETTPLRPQQV